MSHNPSSEGIATIASFFHSYFTQAPDTQQTDTLESTTTADPSSQLLSPEYIPSPSTSNTIAKCSTDSAVVIDKTVDTTNSSNITQSIGATAETVMESSTMSLEDDSFANLLNEIVPSSQPGLFVEVTQGAVEPKDCVERVEYPSTQMEECYSQDYEGVLSGDEEEDMENDKESSDTPVHVEETDDDEDQDVEMVDSHETPHRVRFLPETQEMYTLADLADHILSRKVFSEPPQSDQVVEGTPTISQAESQDGLVEPPSSPLMDVDDTPDEPLHIEQDSEEEGGILTDLDEDLEAFHAPSVVFVDDGEAQHGQVFSPIVEEYAADPLSETESLPWEEEDEEEPTSALRVVGKRVVREGTRKEYISFKFQRNVNGKTIEGWIYPTPSSSVSMDRDMWQAIQEYETMRASIIGVHAQKRKKKHHLNILQSSSAKTTLIQKKERKRKNSFWKPKLKLRKTSH